MQINFNQLSSFINSMVQLSNEETAEFLSYFKDIAVKKRQIIVQPNFIAKNRHFVISGALRAYVIGELGKEHTISLAIENWWITDYNSYIFQQPATMFVIAIEDSIILQIDFDKEQQLKKISHKYETIFRIMAEKGLASIQRRVISNLTKTAEERYDEFISTYPKLVQKIPQYVIASYLGMSTEFLSRIRNKKTKL